VPRILIAGGCGFVGSSLALDFKARGWDVVAFDNLRRLGSDLTMRRLRAHGINYQHGDVRNSEDLEAVGEVDLIIDAAAEPSVHAGYGGDPRYLIDSNLRGVLHCLELARRYKAGFFLLSTSRVFPIAPLRSLALKESETRLELDLDVTGKGVSWHGIAQDFPLGGARSLYGATKLSAENFVVEYVHTYGIKAQILRCGVIAGPYQMGKVDQGFMALWAAAHVYGFPLRYCGFGGHGKQVRDVLHIRDLLSLIQCLIEHFEDPARQLLYVAGGGRVSNISLLELTDLCEIAAGRKISIGSAPETRDADIPFFIADNRPLDIDFGWAPKISVSGCVTDVMAWLETESAQLRPYFIT
jgi:CDP-paratose 2-epimerase